MNGKKILSLFILLFFFSLTLPALQVSLKLSGGMVFMPMKDLNHVLQEWVTYYKTEAEQKASITYLEGEIPDFRSFIDLSGEIIFSVTPWLTLSTGSGISHLTISQEKTTLLLDRPAGTLSYIHPTQTSVIPLTFSAYFNLKISEKVKTYVRAGGGIAWLKYVERSAKRNITKNQKFQWLTLNRCTSQAPILLGGVGIQYELEEGIALFIEGSAQKTKFSDIQGINIDDENGSLYHLQQYDADLDFWLEKYQVYPEMPTGENYRSVSKADLILTGISWKLGLIIRF